MSMLRSIPLVACLLVGCSSNPQQVQQPTLVKAKRSFADIETVEMKRDRAKALPCSEQWLKTAPEAQRKNCLEQRSINQAMNALSTKGRAEKECLDDRDSKR